MFSCSNSMKNTASATMRSPRVFDASHKRSCQKEGHRRLASNGCPISHQAQRGIEAPSQLSPCLQNHHVMRVLILTSNTHSTTNSSRLLEVRHTGISLADLATDTGLLLMGYSVGCDAFSFSYKSVPNRIDLSASAPSAKSQLGLAAKPVATARTHRSNRVG